MGVQGFKYHLVSQCTCLILDSKTSCNVHVNYRQTRSEAAQIVLCYLNNCFSAFLPLAPCSAPHTAPPKPNPNIPNLTYKTKTKLNLQTAVSAVLHQKSLRQTKYTMT